MSSFRALCAELIDALDSGIPAARIRMSPLADRARAALAEPQVEGPPPPNDLSHLSEAEFQTLCPQGYHGVGDDGPAVPEGGEPASVDDEATAALALRVQRLEEMRETEKAALLDAFRQIDDLKQRIDFQYWKIHQLEEAVDPTTSEND